MRKIDKIKNFKKVNLLTEQRYFESKGISGPEIDIDGITDSLVATTMHGGDDNTVYLRAKDSLADSNDQVKGEFYTMLANKMDANNLTSQAQQYRSITQQFRSEF
jgi:MOSC domain-containing protein YiiM